MNDSLKIGEYYTLVLYRKDSPSTICFYEYLSYVDVNKDIIKTTTNPERAIRFDNESDAKIFFFNKFGSFQHHYGTTLIEVAVGKMAVKYELEICKDSYVPCQVKDDREENN
jgi:hypothetical protein